MRTKGNESMVEIIKKKYGHHKSDKSDNTQLGNENIVRLQ